MVGQTNVDVFQVNFQVLCHSQVSCDCEDVAVLKKEVFVQSDVNYDLFLGIRGTRSYVAKKLLPVYDRYIAR